MIRYLSWLLFQSVSLRWIGAVKEYAIINTIAGNGQWGYSGFNLSMCYFERLLYSSHHQVIPLIGDGGVATSAAMRYPEGLTVSPQGLTNRKQMKHEKLNTYI